MKRLVLSTFFLIAILTNYITLAAAYVSKFFTGEQTLIAVFISTILIVVIAHGRIDDKDFQDRLELQIKQRDFVYHWVLKSSMSPAWSLDDPAYKALSNPREYAYSVPITSGEVQSLLEQIALNKDEPMVVRTSAAGLLFAIFRMADHQKNMLKIAVSDEDQIVWSIAQAWLFHERRMFTEPSEELLDYIDAMMPKDDNERMLARIEEVEAGGFLLSTEGEKNDMLTEEGDVYYGKYQMDTPDL